MKNKAHVKLKFMICVQSRFTVDSETFKKSFKPKGNNKMDLKTKFLLVTCWSGRPVCAEPRTLPSAFVHFSAARRAPE